MEMWQTRQRDSRYRLARRRLYRIANNYGLWLCVILVILLYVYQVYPKRWIYPMLYGKPFTRQLTVSHSDRYKDVVAPEFEYKRGGYTYSLLPRTKYAVTARVAFVDNHNTIFNKFFRERSQVRYNNLAPHDLLLLNGDMARSEIFKKFKFKHKKRTTQVLCKSAKYKKSFMSAYMDEEKAKKDNKKYNDCRQYIKEEEYGNYQTIPATEHVNKALSMIVKGDIVYLEGYLVDVPAMQLQTETRKNQVNENYKANALNPGISFILYTTRVIVNNYIYE